MNVELNTLIHTGTLFYEKISRVVTTRCRKKKKKSPTTLKAAAAAAAKSMIKGFPSS